MTKSGQALFLSLLMLAGPSYFVAADAARLDRETQKRIKLDSTLARAANKTAQQNKKQAGWFNQYTQYAGEKAASVHEYYKTLDPMYQNMIKFGTILAAVGAMKALHTYVGGGNVNPAEALTPTEDEVITPVAPDTQEIKTADAGGNTELVDKNEVETIVAPDTQEIIPTEEQIKEQIEKNKVSEGSINDDKNNVDEKKQQTNEENEIEKQNQDGAADAAGSNRLISDTIVQDSDFASMASKPANVLVQLLPVTAICAIWRFFYVPYLRNAAKKKKIDNWYQSLKSKTYEQKSFFKNMSEKEWEDSNQNMMDYMTIDPMNFESIASKPSQDYIVNKLTSIIGRACNKPAHKKELSRLYVYILDRCINAIDKLPNKDFYKNYSLCAFIKNLDIYSNQDIVRTSDQDSKNKLCEAIQSQHLKEKKGLFNGLSEEKEKKKIEKMMNLLNETEEGLSRHLVKIKNEDSEGSDHSIDHIDANSQDYIKVLLNKIFNLAYEEPQHKYDLRLLQMNIHNRYSEAVKSRRSFEHFKEKVTEECWDSVITASEEHEKNKLSELIKQKNLEEKNNICKDLNLLEDDRKYAIAKMMSRLDIKEEELSKAFVNISDSKDEGSIEYINNLLWKILKNVSVKPHRMNYLRLLQIDIENKFIQSIVKKCSLEEFKNSMDDMFFNSVVTEIEEKKQYDLEERIKSKNFEDTNAYFPNLSEDDRKNKIENMMSLLGIGEEELSKAFDAIRNNKSQENALSEQYIKYALSRILTFVYKNPEYKHDLRLLQIDMHNRYSQAISLLQEDMNDSYKLNRYMLNRSRDAIIKGCSFEYFKEKVTEECWDSVITASDKREKEKLHESIKNENLEEKKGLLFPEKSFRYDEFFSTQGAEVYKNKIKNMMDLLNIKEEKLSKAFDDIRNNKFQDNAVSEQYIKYVLSKIFNFAYNNPKYVNDLRLLQMDMHNRYIEAIIEECSFEYFKEKVTAKCWDNVITVSDEYENKKLEAHNRKMRALYSDGDTSELSAIEQTQLQIIKKNQFSLNHWKNRKYDQIKECWKSNDIRTNTRIWLNAFMYYCFGENIFYGPDSNEKPPANLDSYIYEKKKEIAISDHRLLNLLWNTNVNKKEYWEKTALTPEERLCVHAIMSLQGGFFEEPSEEYESNLSFENQSQSDEDNQIITE